MKHPILSLRGLIAGVIAFAIILVFLNQMFGSEQTIKWMEEIYSDFIQPAPIE